MTQEYLEAAVRDAREAEAYAIALEEAFIAAMRIVADFSNDAHLVKWALGVIAEMEGKNDA